MSPKGIYPHTHLKPKVYPPDMVMRVQHLYDGGLTQVEIARHLGTSQKVVWKLMRNHSLTTRPQIKRNQEWTRNAYWKGDAARYQALHMRIIRLLGNPQRCERCGTTDPSKAYDWASLTGNYTEIADYMRMCRSCHCRFDGRVKNLRKGGDA